MPNENTMNSKGGLVAAIIGALTTGVVAYVVGKNSDHVAIELSEANNRAVTAEEALKNEREQCDNLLEIERTQQSHLKARIDELNLKSEGSRELLAIVSKENDTLKTQLSALNERLALLATSSAPPVDGSGKKPVSESLDGDSDGGADDAGKEHSENDSAPLVELRDALVRTKLWTGEAVVGGRTTTVTVEVDELGKDKLARGSLTLGSSSTVFKLDGPIGSRSATWRVHIQKKKLTAEVFGDTPVSAICELVESGEALRLEGTFMSNGASLGTWSVAPR